MAYDSQLSGEDVEGQNVFHFQGPRPSECDGRLQLHFMRLPWPSRP